MVLNHGIGVRHPLAVPLNYISTTMSIEQPTQEQVVQKSGDAQKLEIPDTLKNVIGTERKKEKFDVAKGKQEYVDARLEWMRAGTECDRLSEAQLEAADRRVADPQDIDVEIHFRTITEQLEAAEKRREQLGEQQADLAMKLLTEKNGAKNFSVAKIAFHERLVAVIGEKEQLMTGVYERLEALQERMEKLEELNQKFDELHEKLAELNERFAAAKKEEQELTHEAATLLKSGKKESPAELLAKLRENINKKKECSDKRKLMEDECKGITAAFKELTAEYRELS